MEKKRNDDENTEDQLLLDANRTIESSAIVDWLGRSATGRRLGGWRSSLLFLGCGSLMNAGYDGLFSNFVLYLIRVWDYSNASASNCVTNLEGTMFISALIGAFLGDAYWGRLWTTIVFQFIFFAGSMLASIAVTLGQSNTVPGVKTFLFISLYLAALGEGSFGPAFASLGGDQFDKPQDKSAFFNLLLVFNSIGDAVSFIFITYLENSGRWALGFWLSTSAVGMSVLLLLTGATGSRQYRAGGNPLIRIMQVLVSATRKFNVEAPLDANYLYESPGLSVIPGSRKLRHTAQFRWLDKAATITNSDVVEGGETDPWHLCTVTQVEEVKCIFRIFPFLLINICFNVILAQLSTIFVEQGEVMDGNLGGNFDLPPSSMQLASVLSAVIFATFYEYTLVPLLKRYTGHPKGLTSFQRAGWGLVVGIAAMVVAAVVEMERLERKDETKLSILWLTPQYMMLGIAQVGMNVGLMDFFYTEVSDGMKSLGISLCVISRGLGSYLSSVLVTVATAMSSRGGKAGWIAKDLNEGHVDYFYWLLATLLVVAFLLFLICAKNYTHTNYYYVKEDNLEADS